MEKNLKVNLLNLAQATELSESSVTDSFGQDFLSNPNIFQGLQLQVGWPSSLQIAKMLFHF